MRRKVGIVLVALCSTFLACELGGFLFLRLQRARHGYLFTFSPREVIEALGDGLQAHLAADKPMIPHATVGWTWRADTKCGDLTTDHEGARLIPGAAGPLLMDTYGDSFTECSEVADADTWQAHLARATSTRVRNFGVRGYGPDQAFLAFEGSLAQRPPAPLVVLGLISENMNRVMVAFRPFYTYPDIDHPLGFKPMLLADGGSYRWVNFLPEGRDEAALTAAIIAAGRVDACWADRREAVSFPFSLRAAGYLWRHGVTPKRVWPGQTEEAAKRTAFLFTTFIQRVAAAGAVPVLLFIPMTEADFGLERLPCVHESVQLVPGVERAKVVVIDVVQRFRAKGLSAAALPAQYKPYLRETHPSSQGNCLISDLLLDGLRASATVQANANILGLLPRSEGR